ncbi:hypothetical protein F0P96_06640 [Hymenobacter busanensis]|uniref:Uncharacterized protein n=1 Tax=Hymenobacter busanensis TaxID=2607656 RepID=A0A7L5A0L8_9BACT|nr:hypothetical protein [Hymenobacter busanensis]KAA9338504.1 hypothetical protein F0P96_06640 [Hymenobacter busanensis]QHJ09068.1 hypothetical protein GUY19_17960 [Hymenobacter busanensis]
MTDSNSPSNTSPANVLHPRLPMLLGGLLLLAFPLTASAQTATTPPSAPAAVRPPAQPAGKPAETVSATPAAPEAWKLVRTIALPQPGPASLDRRGNLYVADAKNNLRQFAPDGQPLAVYSPPLPGHTAQVEAWNTTKVLVFYDDRQELLFLDRFLAPISSTRLAEYTDGQIRAATLAPDENLWLLNESDLRLSQFSTQQQRFSINTPLDLLLGRQKPDFRFLREYQNNLYLVDHNSDVWVFDNLGNFRKRLPFQGLTTIGFRGDELYFLKDGQLHFFHLYQLKERTQPLPTPAGTAVSQVLVGEQYAYCFLPEGVAVYQLPLAK